MRPERVFVDLADRCNASAIRLSDTEQERRPRLPFLLLQPLLRERWRSRFLLSLLRRRLPPEWL
jgi:hypothetical protein